MKVDKDRPGTWRLFFQKNCDNCLSLCCTMPVEITLSDLVRLGVVFEDEFNDSPKKIINQLKKNKIIKSYRESTQLFQLEHSPTGDCLYLSKERRCTVYDSRPEVCRKFPTEMGIRKGYCPSVALKPVNR